MRKNHTEETIGTEVEITAELRELKANASPELLYLTATESSDFALQAAEQDDDGKPKGPRSFSMTGYTGGPMEVGFGMPVVVDLAGLAITAKSRPILRDHNPAQIVGHSDVISNDGKRIKLTGKLSASNAHAAEIEASAAAGFPWQASIGASIERMIRLDEGESIQVNGRKITGPVLVARKSRLREVSFVALGADDNTSARLAASFQRKAIPMGYEAWLAAKGFDIDTLSDEQNKVLKAAYDAELKASGGGNDDTSTNDQNAPKDLTAGAKGGDGATALDIKAAREEYRKELAAERKRITAIEAKAKELPSEKAAEIVAKAIEEDWPVMQAECELLRASRETAPAPAGHIKGKDKDATLQAMQGSLMLRAGVSFEDRSFQSKGAYSLGLPDWLKAGINAEQKQKSMEAAHRYSDMSLLDMCREAIRLDGGYVPSHGSRKKIIEAAFSGSALTEIFTTSVNASLLSTYMQTLDTTRGWTSEKDVADFKTNDRIRLAKGAGLKKLPRGKTAKHQDRSDSKESYKIARFAKQFVVDEQDIIDDSMDAFSDIAPDMGEAAARIRPDLVYAILLANADLADAVALFHTSHSNDASSAALAALTLKAAIAALEKQRENGVNLNLRASHLIVPSDLKHLAGQLIQSAETRNTTATTEAGTENTIRTLENLQLVSDSRLANGVVDPDTGTEHSGSATKWYLASAMAHTIEVGYLRGTGRAPQVRSFTLDKGQYGVGWDVAMDIGAKALDYRGLQRREQ